MSRITSANSVPFDLREGEKEVFVGEQRMLAAARLFDRAVDDALRGFADLARRDVEIFYVHGRLRFCERMQQDVRQSRTGVSGMVPDQRQQLT